MNLNSNSQQDVEQAWKESGLHYGQIVKFQGNEYKVVAVGYGILLKGKIRIANERETLQVNLKEVEVV